MQLHITAADQVLTTRPLEGKLLHLLVDGGDGRQRDVATGVVQRHRQYLRELRVHDLAQCGAPHLLTCCRVWDKSSQLPLGQRGVPVIVATLVELLHVHDEPRNRPIVTPPLE